MAARAWILTGALTIVGALSCGELATLMPRAGGQYVYLREAFNPLCGFLSPAIADDHSLISPTHLSAGYALWLSRGWELVAGVADSSPETRDSDPA
jgi:APA family basic amino acid/polyamine antiporter